MTTVNLNSAKTNLARRVDQVENGEEVVIARAGKPVARVVPFHKHAEKTRRVLGGLGSRPGRRFALAS